MGGPTGRSPAVLQVFQPSDGGVAAYVEGLAVELDRRRWNVVVACDPASSVAVELRRAGVRVEAFVARRSPSARDLTALTALARIIRRHRPALLHAHSSKAGLIAGAAGRILDLPTVYTPHGWSFQMENPRLVRVGLAGIEAVAAKAFHEVIVPVCVNEGALALRWHVAPAKRVIVVRSGRSIASRAPVDAALARRRIGLPETGPIVAWIGRDAPPKRPEDLPVLAARLAAGGVLLAALGGGLETSRIADAVRSAGGTIVSSEISPGELLEAADVLAMTSAWEGLPLVVIEALEKHVPVVAYDVGGLGEQVVHGKNGYLVPFAELDDLAARLLALSFDQALLQRLRFAARRMWEDRFRPEQMVDRIELIYEHLLRGRGIVRPGADPTSPPGA